MILYTVYRTTNKINGMFYIGVHKTTEPQDDYLGSGKRLKYAIKKYGVENFEKEILHVFEDAKEAFAKEKELVTEEVLDSGKCYNLKLGGEGGFDFVNDLPKMKNVRSQNGILFCHNSKFQKNRAKRVTLKTRIKATSTLKEKYPHGTFAGKFHSSETKEKMKRSAKGKHLGTKNSQYGTMWITDGILNKKIKKDQEIPDGWKKGRM